jgi:NADPH:quinone reductase-like Zn-dependent oxidoreductase
LLIAVSSLGPTRFNAWQALDLVPVLLMVTVQIVDPPAFAHIAGVSFEGAVRYPAYLALIAAAVVGLGGLLALREAETPFLSRLPDPTPT